MPARLRYLAELAPTVAGKPDVQSIQGNRLEWSWLMRYRMQRIVFETAREVYDQMHHWLAGVAARFSWPNWSDWSKSSFKAGTEFVITPHRSFIWSDLRRRLTITLNLNEGGSAHSVCEIGSENTEKLEIVFDS